MFYELIPRQRMISFIIWGVICLLLSSWPVAQAAPPQKTDVKKEVVELVPAPVVFSDKTLFYVQAKVLSFAPQERAKIIEERISKLANDPLLQIESIKAIDDGTVSQIAAGDLIIMSVTKEDAKAGGLSQAELAREYARIIIASIVEHREVYSMQAMISGGVFAALLTALYILAIFLIKKLFIKVLSSIESRKGLRIPTVKLQKLELISSEQIGKALIIIAKLLRVFISLLAFYLYAIFVLQLFPWTKNLSSKIVGYIVKPLRMFGHAITSYLPDFFVLVVILVITYYGLKLIKFVFSAVGNGIVTFHGFHREWADPTYAIARILVISFAAVVAFPYMPGSDSPAFKGISLFVGLLLSFGSTSAVGNMVAGVIITYMRAFKIGDRVRIADTTGDVLEKSLLVTRVRTIKNEAITIPNASVLSNHIINYSSSFASGLPLILHTGVTIGYDAPWRKVHELLLAAAGSTERILKSPAPFILQTGLDDFYVHYELNAYTQEATKMATIYSDLHQNIQDKFNEGGVEIMSPHYGSLRDGNMTTIPENYLPRTYTAPPFRMQQVEDEAHEKI